MANQNMGFQVEAEEDEGQTIRLYNMAEDEGTGGDGYNQNYQARNQNYIDFGNSEEGAVVVGGAGDDEEGDDYNEDNNNLRGRGLLTSTGQDAVGG